MSNIYDDVQENNREVTGGSAAWRQIRDGRKTAKVGNEEYRKTGTYSDALEAKSEIVDWLRPENFVRHETVWRSMEPGLGRPIPAAERAALLDGWRAELADGAAVIYVAADLVDPILESAKTVPEIGAPADLRLPRSGFVLLGQAIPDEYQTTPEGRERYLLAAALSWSITKPVPGEVEVFWGGNPDGRIGFDVAREAGKLTVTPWLHSKRGWTPTIPAWLDGVAPRAAGTDYASGMKYGWAESPTHFIRFVTALDGWMHSAVDVEDRKADRPTRRRAERRGVKADAVTVVKFRKAEAKRSDSDTLEGRTVDWSHRWVVGGHWHNYRCGPRKSRTRAVWVNPYIRGPADKPLKNPQKILKVDR